MGKLILILLPWILLLQIDLFGQRKTSASDDQFETYKNGLTDMVEMLFYITSSSVTDSTQENDSISAETPAVKEMVAYVDTIVNPVRPMSKQDLSTALQRASDVLIQILKSNKRPRQDAEIDAMKKISKFIMKAYSGGAETNEMIPEEREYTTWEIFFAIYVVVISISLIGMIAFLRFETLKNLRKIVAFIAVSSGIVDHGKNFDVERIK